MVVIRDDIVNPINLTQSCLFFHHLFSGKQIKVLKKILKGLKEKKSNCPKSSEDAVSSIKTAPNAKPKVIIKQQQLKSTTRSSSGNAEVQLGIGRRVNVQDGIMVSNKCACVYSYIRP